MILKKKVSAITAMMALLGGVLCNSDNVTAMDSQKNTYTTTADFVTNKLIDTVRDIKKKKKSNNMPKTGKSSVGNEDEQEIKNDEMTTKKTIKIQANFDKAGSIFDNKEVAESLFSTLQELGWKKSDDPKEEKIKGIRKCMSECEQAVKVFDEKFKELIKWTLECTDEDITKKIMDEIIKNIKQSFPDQKIDKAIEICNRCYTQYLLPTGGKYNKTFYQLITNESKNNSEKFLKSFLIQFANNTLVQTRNTYNTFLNDFDNIIKNSAEKKQNKKNKKVIQNYDLQKSTLESMCKVCKETNNMKNFIEFFKGQNNNDTNLFISFIAQQIVNKNIVDILEESDKTCDNLISEAGKVEETKQTIPFFKSAKKTLQIVLNEIQSTSQHEGEEGSEEGGEEGSEEED